MDLQNILSKVNEILPPQPAVRFTVEKCDQKLGLFDSKIGGTPYFPKGMEYPTGRKNEFDGQPLTLLAQLNFEQLPHIPDFPEKGILQFFIAGDDLYGMSEDFGERMASEDNFRVIYHEDIITDETKLLSEDEIPKYTGGEEMLPFTGEYLLKAHEAELIPANVCDYRFGDAFVKCYNETADEPIETFWEKIDEETYNEIYESAAAADAFIGGYPVFTQDDPRSEDNFSEFDVVLFELDSYCNNDKDIDIMWGDAGTGTFLIPRDRLKALDFSRVLYNYDCC